MSSEPHREGARVCSRCYRALPQTTVNDGEEVVDPITAGELARAVEFAQHADNPASAADLQQIAIESGIDWRSLLDNGIEDADD